MTSPATTTWAAPIAAKATDPAVPFKPVEPPLFNSLRAALLAGTQLAFPVAK